MSENHGHVENAQIFASERPEFDPDLDPRAAAFVAWNVIQRLAECLKLHGHLVSICSVSEGSHVISQSLVCAKSENAHVVLPN